MLASFATLGDVLVAEPGALMSFAGPRVVQQTTREKLPDDFGLAESNSASATSTRSSRDAEQRATIAPLLRLFEPWPSEAELRLRERLAKLSGMRLLSGSGLSGELERLERQLDRIAAEPTDEEIWRSVELARHQERPYTLDYVDAPARRLGRAARRPRARRRRGDRRRPRRASPAARSCSSATRRAATSRSGRSGTSAWPIRRATARRCG